MIYGNTGAGLGVIATPSVSSYADSVVPTSKTTKGADSGVDKLKMAAYGVPEMDDIDYDVPKFADDLDVEPQAFQEYSTLINKLQEAAIMGRQAGIDVTKPGQNPTAQEFSKEWFRLYNRAAELKNILQTSQQVKKNLGTRSSVTGVVTNPYDREKPLSYSDMPELTMNKNTAFSGINSIGTKFNKVLKEYDPTNLEGLKQETAGAEQRILDEGEFLKERYPNYVDDIDQAVASNIALIRQPLLDVEKRDAMSLRQKQYQLGLAKFDLDKEKFKIFKQTKGAMTDEDIDTYFEWWDGAVKGGITEQGWINGAPIKVTTRSESGVPTTSEIRADWSEWVTENGKPKLKVYGKVGNNNKYLLRAYDFSDPNAGALELYLDTRKEKGNFGYTPQENAIPTQKAPKVEKPKFKGLPPTGKF